MEMCMWFFYDFTVIQNSHHSSHLDFLFVGLKTQKPNLWRGIPLGIGLQASCLILHHNVVFI